MKLSLIALSLAAVACTGNASPFHEKVIPGLETPHSLPVGGSVDVDTSFPPATREAIIEAAWDAQLDVRPGALWRVVPGRPSFGTDEAPAAFSRDIAKVWIDTNRAGPTEAGDLARSVFYALRAE